MTVLVGKVGPRRHRQLQRRGAPTVVAAVTGKLAYDVEGIVGEAAVGLHVGEEGHVAVEHQPDQPRARGGGDPGACEMPRKHLALLVQRNFDETTYFREETRRENRA